MCGADEVSLGDTKAKVSLKRMMTSWGKESWVLGGTRSIASETTSYELRRWLSGGSKTNTG